MKLIDCKPKWIDTANYTSEDGALHFPRYGGTKRKGMGLTFEDPQHPSQRLGIYFQNPIDELPPALNEKLWHREGDSFETLTITPSIDCSSSGFWHGNIVNGEMLPG